jgi:ribosomal protein S16
MLKIKLVRKGKRNLPSFRVAVTNGEKVVEFIGSYYPHSARSHFVISKDDLERWSKSGAQITPAVASLLKGKYEFKKYVPKSAEKEAGPVAPAAVAAVPGPAPAESPAPEEVPPAAPETPAPESPPEEKKEVESAPKEEAKPNA